jgi:ATP-binding protein involved in chromosome partitioning
MSTTDDELRARVREQLAALHGPDGRSLTEGKRLSEIVVRGGKAYFFISVASPEAAAWEPVRLAAERAAAGVPGITAVVASLSAERAAGPGVAGSKAAATTTSTTAAEPPADARGFPAIAEVRHIVAVASGKGGVGKSTTACNLALALKALGLRVGLLDADIYGPSAPKLFGLRAKPQVIGERTLVPLDGFGVKVMSIGFVVEEAKALVWRGPMVMGAITQMLRDVAWGPLDVLIVDMPPGTGDAQLTMAQSAPLSGAVIVSTPQDLALIDARKGVAMFRQVDVPILGIIENMSWFVCDGCGKRHEIFSHGGARREAERMGVPLLGEIALDPLIRERSDAGLPIVVSEPDSVHAAVYLAVAQAIQARLDQALPRRG